MNVKTNLFHCQDSKNKDTRILGLEEELRKCRAELKREREKWEREREKLKQVHAGARV